MDYISNVLRGLTVFKTRTWKHKLPHAARAKARAVLHSRSLGQVLAKHCRTSAGTCQFLGWQPTIGPSENTIKMN